MRRVRLAIPLVVAALGAFAFGVSKAQAVTLTSAAAPSAPTGVTAIALDGRVELAWQPVSGVTYDVYRGGTLVSPANLSATTFTDTSLANGTPQTYTVRSLAGSTESVDSIAVQATPQARSCSAGNPVVLENCYPGSNGWQLVGSDPVSSGGVAGFATANSINHGGSVDVKIDGAGGHTYSIGVYRLGYYNGAGGRLITTIKNVPGTNQPACSSDPNTGLYDCSNWTTSATLTTTSSWPSGEYMLHVVRDDTGSDTQIPLTIRNDASTSAVVYGVPYNTYEAYNNYGGKSLYSFNSSGANTVAGTPRAVKVSFDRPFAQVGATSMRDWFLRADYPLVYWLEREGYDVSYIADTDLETQAVGSHKAFVIGVHSEYWSANMRAALTTARDNGVSIFDSGGNAIYWKVRFENGPNSGTNRVEVDYKTIESGIADPLGTSATGRWRDPAIGQPENALLGEMYVGDNDNASYPLVVSAAEGQDPAFRNTGLDTQAPGASTTLGTGLLGWEWDARVGNGQEPAGVKTLATSPVTGNLIQPNGTTSPGSTSSNVTKYTVGTSTVFDTGSMYWSRGLALTADGQGEPNHTIQQITTNVFVDMGAPPATPAADMVVSGATTQRPPAPASVTSPSQQTDRITLSWPAVTDADGYYVYRSSSPRIGGLPLGTQLNNTALTTTSFTDTGLATATVYYYVVTAAKAGLQSTASTELEVATAGATAGPIRINVGGPGYTDAAGNAWVADTDFNGGQTRSTTNTITGTTDRALYQDERWGVFNYAIPVVNGTYDVRIHSAETFYTSPCAGERVFKIDVVDSPTKPDINGLDICATVGPNAAYVKTITNVQVTDGVVDVSFQDGTADDPVLSAIEVIPSGSPGSGTGGDTTGTAPPVVTAKTPADLSTGVNTGAGVTATFSRAIDPTSIQAAGAFTLTPAGSSTPVAATVTYNNVNNTATLTPTAALSAGTTYTARISGTVDAAGDGTPLGTPVTWSFSTAGAGCPCTLFSSTLQPDLGGISTIGAAGLGTTTLEVGVKFRVDQAMRLTAVRFYKDPQETGSHTMTIWTTSGIPLATIPFTNEIPSGWQQQVLSTPLSLQANTVYIASVGLNAFWGRTTGGLATQIDSGSLHSVADGANGVFSGAEGTFPNQTFGNTNYFVDVQVSAAGIPVAPTVTGTNPANGATGTARGTAVSATFSTALDPTTVTTTTFNLTRPDGSTVPATVAYTSATNTVTLTPSAALDPSVTYTAHLTTGVHGSDGTPLASPVAWTFETGSSVPTVVANSPAGGATAVATTVAPTVTFSEAMNASTINSTTVTLSTFGNGTIPATVTYNSTTDTATITPTSALASGTTFTVRVDGTAQALDGTPLGTAFSFNFTTAGCPCSLFLPTAQPSLGGISTVGAAGANSTSLELGVKFKVDSPRRLSALRFYKDPLETGTHVGSLWSADGRLLARVAFTNETASGWQQQALPNPILLQADTVYIASVNANAFWGRTLNGLGNQIDNGPLHSVADGHNGVFAGAAGSFPNQDSGSANYFTDVVVVDNGTPAAAIPTTVSPANGVTAVAWNTAVRVTFNRSMNGTTLTPSTFTLTPAGGTPIAASVAYDDPSLTATLTPSAPLSPSTVYTAQLSTAVQTSDGVPLVSSVQWTFTTASAPPTVVGTSPAAGATAVPVTVSPTVTFSRAMNPSTLSDITLTVSPSGHGPLAGLVTLDPTGTIATFTPAATLSSGTQYTLAVTTSVQSADGIAIASQVSSSFTTQAAPPTVTAATPINGATGVALNVAPTITFSKPMTSSVNATTVTLTKSGSSSPVTATVALDSTGTVATLTPAQPLSANAAYTLSVAASVQSTDSGVLGTAFTSSFQTIVDTTPPDTIITVAPARNTATPSVSFTSEAGATFQCQIDGGTYTTCSSPLALGPFTDNSSHTFNVEATDAAGNTDPTPATVSWTVDLTAPKVTITGTPANPTNSTLAAFGYSVDDSTATVACTLDTVAVSCSSTAFSTTVGSGQHTFTVTATDAAGNKGTAGYSWTVDTTAPVVTLGAKPASLTNSTAASFTYSVDDSTATVACTLDTVSVTCSKAGYSGTVGSGRHTFTVAATDAAGNSGSASYTWTVDTTAPTVTLTGQPAALTNQTTAAFSYTVDDATASVACKLDNTSVTCSSTGYSGTVGSGQHTFTVTATDGAGNAGSATSTWTVDTTPPVVTLGTKPASLTNSTTASFTYSVDDATASVACTLDTVSVTCGKTGYSGTVAGGSHTFIVTATDGAGNKGTATYTWVVDLTAPTVTLTGKPAGLTNQTTATFSYTVDDATATVACKVDTTTVTCSNTGYSGTVGGGQHTFSATATDGAGNSSTTSYVWTVDLTPPTVTITSKPGNPSNNTTPSFAFSSSKTGSTFQCQIDTGTSTACNTGTYTAATLTAASHTFTVTATDPAGNTGTASYTWTVDLTPPTVTITAEPANPTNSTQAAFTYSSNDSTATVACTLDTVAVTCSSTSYSGTVASGGHTFTVTATDAAGNKGTATYTWTVDTTAPTVTLSSDPSSPTSSTLADFSYSSNDPTATVACTLDTLSVGCGSTSYSGTVGTGSHTFTVSATDGAGNTGSASTTWTVDTTPPTVTLTGKPASLTNSTAASFTYSVDDPTATVACVLDTVPATCSTTGYSGTVGGGQHTFTVTATDPAGNKGTATYTWTVDITPPTVTITGKPGNPSNNTTPSFAFTSSKTGSTFQCQINTGTSTACNTGSYTTSALAAGTYTFTVTATDPAGNTGIASYAWTVDLTAPDTTITGPPARNSATPSVSFTSEAGATFQCQIDGGSYSTCTSPLALGGPFADASTHTFAVKATDAAGNTDPTPATVTWTVDLTAPTTTITAKPSDPSTSTTANFSFGASETGVSFQCKLDSAAYTGCASSVTLTNLSDARHTLSVTATDSAGNTGPAASYSWTVDTPPAVTAPLNQSALEGSAASFSVGSFTDSGAGEGPWSVNVSWGDSSSSAFSATAPGTLPAQAHTYANRGTYTVTVTVTDALTISGSATFTVTVGNVAPIVTAAADQSTTEGAATGFDLGSFSAASAADGPWTVTVDWNDGSIAETFTATARGALGTRTHAYAKPGTYHPSLKVTDSAGLSDSKTFAVAVANVAPTVSTTNQTANEGTATSLDVGSFSDPGASDGPWSVTVAWGDGSTDTFSTLSRGALGTRTHTYATPGNDTATVTVTDALGLAGSQTFTVGVQNVAPTVTAAANQSASEGSAGTFDLGSFTDPGANDGPWSVDVNWGDTSPHTLFSAATRGALGTQPHTYSTAGTYTATVTVSDRLGLSDAKSFTVAVGNVAPTVAITGADAIGQEGTPIVLGANVTDPGVGETLTYSWNIAKNGATFVSGSGTTITFTPDDNATWSATLTVTDGKGGSGSDSKSITVLNVAPTVTAASNGPVNEGSAATITAATPFDPSAADTLAGFHYVFGCDTKPAQATYAGSAAATSSPCTFDDGPSDHTAWVEIVDKDGGYSYASTIVHVLDVLPTASFTPPMSVPEGSAFSLSLANPFDPSAADTTTLSYTFDCGTGFGLPQALPTANCTALPTGSYTLRATISDKNGSTTYTSPLTVTNVPPTPSIAGAPSTSPEGTAISLTGSATDPGGASDVKTYAWSVTKNGAVWGPTSATQTFGFTPDDNGSYVVTLTATDANGGVGTTTATINVTNVAPVPTITAPPTSGIEGTPITVNGTSTDASPVDATSLTQSWAVTRNGNPFATGSGSSVTFTPLTGTYVVTLTATDKNNGTASTSTTIAVANVAPAPSIDNAPASSPEGTGITLGSTPHDPGASAGDTYTYSWSVTKDGSSYGTAGTASTYSFTPNDNGSYVVSLTVKDADGSSGTATTTIAVTNVAPTATLSNSGPVNEGSAATITFSSGADASSVDAAALHYAITCDGSAPSTDYTLASTSATKSCVFDDGPAAPVVKGVVIDKDGGYSSYSTTVTVNNVAPTATFNAPASVNEGSPIALSLSAPTDPSQADRTAGFTYAFDCGSGYGAFGSSSSTSCPTTDNGTTTVKGKIQDKNGGVTEYTQAVTIANVAPTATLTAPDSVPEGTAISVSLTSPSDPSSADTAAGFTYAFDCGSGLGAFSSTNSTSCPTSDNGTVTVKGQIKDKDGGVTSYTKAVTVTNVAPSGNWPATANAVAGTPLTLSWNAVADPSSADMTAGLHYAYDCTGAPITATYATAGTSTSISCTFASAGTSTVSARVIDKDGGSSDYMTTVTVASLPPTAAFTSGSSSIPGGTASGTQFTYSGTITNGDATTTVAADCGTVAIVSGSLTYTTDTSGNRNGFSFKCAFTYTTPTTYTLHATAKRGTVTGATATMTVTITSAPPVVTITSPAATWIGSRGSTLTVLSSFTDAGGAANGPYTCTIDWGDGSAKTVLTIASPGSCNSSHMYIAAATLLTVTVTDKYGVSASATRALRVV